MIEILHIGELKNKTTLHKEICMRTIDDSQAEQGLVIK